MKHYIVEIHEIWIQEVEVEANDAKDAICRVQDEEGEELSLDFSHIHDYKTREKEQ